MSAIQAEKTYRGYTVEQIAQTIDHSVLKPENSYADIEDGARIAATYRTASYCVRPVDVSRAASLLSGSGVPVCTVIGFPHGTTTTATKVSSTLTFIFTFKNNIQLFLIGI